MTAVGLLALVLGCAPKPVPVQAAPPPPPPLQARPPRDAELIYFVLVDRFANGDPTNDQASPGPAPDLSDPQAWHGGDLRGVTEHLDHLEQLGVTTVWLSPVFRTRTEPIGGWGAFHGYWQWDPLQVEPRFGTPQDLEDLARALQQRRMGLMLDLVTNHVGYDAPLLAEHPDWFHDAGTIEDWTDRQQLEQGQVHGLPDLDQDEPAVAAWLQQAAEQWQERLGLRGFRVDAVRHVPNAFLADLGRAVLARQPDAWWLGEDFTGDVSELAESQRSGGFTHVFDFPLHYAMTDVFCDDAPPARLASVLWQDRLYDHPEGLVTFLDNHDLPRIWSRCHEDLYAGLRALVFMYATRGVPALTYGTEARLLGADEPDNRGDMVFADDDLTPLLGLLMEHRRASPAMRGGVQRVLHLDDDSMVLARVSGDRAVVVGVNRGEEAVWMDLPPPLDSGIPMGLLSQHGHEQLHSVAAPGGMDLQTVGGYAPHGLPGREIPPRGVRIWRLQGDFSDFQAQGATVQIDITATGLPPAARRVVLVGAGPELGGWDPARGIPLQSGPSGWTGSLSVPEGAVLEGKLVVMGAQGPRWADGENEALLVGSTHSWQLEW